MKLLFNIDVIEGNRIRASPSEYLRSLPVGQQAAAVNEFLDWAVAEARDNQDPQARAEAEIGIATAKEYLDKLQPTIYTSKDREEKCE